MGQREQVVGDEPRTRGIDVAVARDGLSDREKALRCNAVAIIFRPGHRDIGETTLLLDVLLRAGCKSAALRMVREMVYPKFCRIYLGKRA